MTWFVASTIAAQSLDAKYLRCRVLHCCSVLQCVAGLQSVVACCNVLQCVSVCFSVLQCVAVCDRYHV